MSWDVQDSSALLFIFLSLGAWLGGCQDPVVSSEMTCVNGELVPNSDNDSILVCQCFPGWTGTDCSLCRGKMRLTNSSGIIADDAAGMDYARNTQCLFYIEANQSVSSIHLRIQFLHLECLWDYLYVFDGSSLFSPILAAYTGNVIEQSTFVSNFTGELVPQHTLSSSGPEILLYFFTDAGLEAPGFEIAYWLDYECPEECSGRGACNASTGLCICDSGWTGEACHIPTCPLNCSGNGLCDADLDQCVCSAGYQGEDCSTDVLSAHWSAVSYNSSLPSLTLARAGHTSLLWEESMLVYGGYRFPEEERDLFGAEGDGTTEGWGSGAEPQDELLRYSLESGVWEVLETSAAEELEVEAVVDGNVTVLRVPHLPAPRYGHSAVIYDGSMYVFGGSLYPSEVMTSELWRLDLTSLKWHPLFNQSSPTSDNSSAPLLQLPVPVRGHTAHVVGGHMLVLFGLSSGAEEFPAYIQRYDFMSGEWSLADQQGAKVSGRMGHSSVLDEETSLIYLHGGRGAHFRTELFSYDTVCGVWSKLPVPSGSVRYLHSSVLLGPVLLSFAGCQGHDAARDCFSSDLLLYNTLCSTWDTLQLPGLPANASRFGHTSVVDSRPQGDGGVVVFGGFVGTTRGDMLRLELLGCGRFESEEECVNGSALCAWRGDQGDCVSVLEVGQVAGVNLSFSCPVGQCVTLDISACSSTDGCQWSSTASRCFPEDEHVPGTSCPTPPATGDLCANFTTCQSCQLHDCIWARKSNETKDKCFSDVQFSSSPVNITEVETCAATSCFTRDSCETCTTSGGCLWCPSLSRCVGQYPTAFTFGQCLGWVNRHCNDSRCQLQTNCSSCQELSQCGWCNDPSDTGLGSCSLGGFGGPHNDSFCTGSNALGIREEWQFYQCSACQCNGHSTCAEGSSVCEQCMNNTSGQHCESCALGFYGQADNGGSCAECDCNGYDPECDQMTGACDCQALGVTGVRCTNCSTSGDYANGDANNFCYADLAVGFIYTFSVTSDNEVQGFYAITPPHDDGLHFKFEMVTNPSQLPVFIQLFVGRKSENLWVLVNLTDPVAINTRGSFEKRFDSFSGSRNQTASMLTSFTHPAIRDTDNFTAIFDEAVEDDYTSRMWDGDVSLVLYISNLNSPSSYKITVDQENFIYLLYFFATFITCFSVLLTVFLLAWFIKKKLALRAYMRQQYIELQRRVARPFGRITLKVDTGPASSPSRPLPAEQNPSYVGVEACRDDKGAVLSLMVQLPGDPATGRPSHGRPGLCLGSTLVYVNSSKKPKQNNKKKSPPRGQGEGQSTSSSSSAVTIRSGSSGGARQRNFSDSVA